MDSDSVMSNSSQSSRSSSSTVTSTTASETRSTHSQTSLSTDSNQDSSGNNVTEPSRPMAQPRNAESTALRIVRSSGQAASAIREGQQMSRINDVARSPQTMTQVVRHQQQRLLLLRHAAKCNHEENTCPVTPHCTGMKKLWNHIVECKDQKCITPHCVSSRYVLSHYHRCRDLRCIVCGPVREAIHRSTVRQRQMRDMRASQATTTPGVSNNANNAAAPNSQENTVLAVARSPMHSGGQRGSVSSSAGNQTQSIEVIARNQLRARLFNLAMGHLNSHSTTTNETRTLMARRVSQEIEARLFEQRTASQYHHLSDQELMVEVSRALEPMNQLADSINRLKMG